MILTWDRRMERMQALGFVSLHMRRPFDWRCDHATALVLAGDDAVVPQGQGTNPYDSVDDLWRQMTHDRPTLIVPDKGTLRLLAWSGQDWVPALETRRAA